MNRHISAVVASILFAATALILSGCSVSSAQLSACFGTAQEGASLFRAIATDTSGNNRLAAAEFLGSGLESGWRDVDSSDGAFGWWQIQNPGVSGGPNPSITVQQAHDAAYSTNYMTPQYSTALGQVDTALWVNNPELAAEKTVVGAERPREDYYAARGPQTVHMYWEQSLAHMRAIGISTNFSGIQNIPYGTKSPKKASPSSTSGSCGSGSGGYSDTGQVAGWSAVYSNYLVFNRAMGSTAFNRGICGIITSYIWHGAQDGYGYAAASDAWYDNNSSVRHTGRDVPLGAILIFAANGPQAAPEGHVEIYAGHGNAINDGTLTPADYPVSHWEMKYLGWIDPNDLGWSSRQASSYSQISVSGYL